MCVFYVVQRSVVGERGNVEWKNQNTIRRNVDENKITDDIEINEGK